MPARNAEARVAAAKKAAAAFWSVVKGPDWVPPHDDAERKRRATVSRAKAPSSQPAIRKPYLQSYYLRTKPRRQAEHLTKYLARAYKMSLAEYQALSRKGCAICGASTEPRFGRLPVDHCHRCGGTRGLLCDPCNRAVGGFKDDPRLLERAIAYLARHGCREESSVG